MAQRTSLAMSRASSELSAEAPEPAPAAAPLGTNMRSVAYAVYANRGDPYAAGYRAPTTRDIPQLKLPRVERPADDEITEYIERVRRSVRGSSTSSLSTDGMLDLAGSNGPADPGATDGAAGGAPNGNSGGLPNGLAPLDAMPDVFFSDDFQLNNPRTFDAVLQRGGADAAVTQEQLSWYVDLVEAHLAHEIASASTQFFAVTAQFAAIEGDAHATTRSVARSIEKVKAQQAVVAHYRETAALQRQRSDAYALVAAMDAVAAFSAAVDAVDATLADNDTPLAAKIAVLRDVQVQAAGPTQSDAQDGASDGIQPINFSRLHLAQPLLERIEIAETQLKTSARSIYSAAMLRALRAACESASSTSSTRTTSSIEDLRAAADEALACAGDLGVRRQALEQYQNEVDREIKLVVRRNLPPSSSPSSAGSGTTTGADTDDSQALARSLHGLSPADAETMIQNIFEQLTALLSSLHAQHVPEVGAALLEASVSNIDSRLARVLRVRKDPASSLPPAQFVRFFTQVTEFGDFVESLGAGATTELREFLVAQTKLYVHSLHEASETRLAATMDADDWKRIDVRPEVQTWADGVAYAGLRDPPLDTRVASPPPADTAGAASSTAPNGDAANPSDTATGTASTATTRLDVDGQTFLISKSAAVLLRQLFTLLLLVAYLPPAQSLVAARATVELLQTFNHKTYAQVIGHGAIKTAGLKHINIRNLLLAHETLRLVETLMLALRKAVERHSGVNGMAFAENQVVGRLAIEVLRSFDTVQQKYFDHRADIQQRLVKLLGDKAITAARHILAANWSQPQTAASSRADPASAAAAAAAAATRRSDADVGLYMVDLMRQTSHVARVAQEMIPASIAEEIVAKTYGSYKAKLLEAYSQLEIKTPLEKRNVLLDLNYFREKSEALTGAGNTADVLFETVNNFVAPEFEGDLLNSPIATKNAPVPEPETEADPEPEPETEAEAEAGLMGQPDRSIDADQTMVLDTSPVEEAPQVSVLESLQTESVNDFLAEEPAEVLAAPEEPVQSTAAPIAEDSAAPATEVETEEVANEKPDSLEAEQGTSPEEVPSPVKSEPQVQEEIENPAVQAEAEALTETLSDPTPAKESTEERTQEPTQEPEAVSDTTQASSTEEKGVEAAEHSDVDSKPEATEKAAEEPTPTKAEKPVEASESSRVETAEVTETAEIAESSKVGETRTVVEPAEPVEFTKTAKTTEVSEPADVKETAETEVSKSDVTEHDVAESEVAETPKEVNGTEESKPTENTKPTEDAKPTEDTKPVVEESKTSDKSNSSEESKPSEATNTSEATEPSNGSEAAQGGDEPGKESGANPPSGDSEPTTPAAETAKPKLSKGQKKRMKKKKGK